MNRFFQLRKFDGLALRLSQRTCESPGSQQSLTARLQG